MKRLEASPTRLSPVSQTVSSAGETAVERAYGSIRAALLTGRYLPGTHLKEENLAAEIGVSRTPIRHAMMRLVADGMLQYTPNQGVTVKVWTRSEITEIFRLRAMLEGYGAELAAERIEERELDLLRQLDEQMAALVAGCKTEWLAELSQLNGQFHRTIYRAAQSARLAQMLGNLIEIPLVLHTFQRYSDDQLRQSISHHHELVLALASHDSAWAGSVMRAHIFAAKNALCDM